MTPEVWSESNSLVKENEKQMYALFPCSTISQATGPSPSPAQRGIWIELWLYIEIGLFYDFLDMSWEGDLVELVDELIDIVASSCRECLRLAGVG